MNGTSENQPLITRTERIRMPHLRTTIAATIACAAIVACKSHDNAGTDSSNGAPASATATPRDTGAAASATGKVDSATATTNATVTDANILAKADAGDSAEVAIAKYVRSQSTNAGVKAYASLLESDHGKGISKVEGTAKTASIAMQLPPNDTTAQETQHTLDHLKSLKGHDLDTAFVNHEIQDHQADIDDANKMAAAAQNPEVKKLVQGELPELKKHLDKAQALSKQLESAKK
jgi:putative membrane protein